jgi:hypothetical protein
MGFGHCGEILQLGPSRILDGFSRVGFSKAYFKKEEVD